MADALRANRESRGLVGRIDRRFYPRSGDHWDDALFREALLRHVDADTDALEIGAGSGRIDAMNLRGIARRVVGLDPDPRVRENPWLDEAVVGSGEAIPCAAGRFDLVFCNNVLEHVREPLALFQEVARVLRPGGRFLLKTPNRRHYVTLAARVTPHGFHARFNRWRGRPTDQTFPTLYRANDPRRIRELARRAGLRVHALELHEGRPEYLRRWPAAYLLGLAYERTVNRFGALRGLRVLLVATLERPTRGHP